MAVQGLAFTTSIRFYWIVFNLLCAVTSLRSSSVDYRSFLCQRGDGGKFLVRRHEAPPVS